MWPKRPSYFAIANPPSHHAAMQYARDSRSGTSVGGGGMSVCGVVVCQWGWHIPRGEFDIGPDLVHGWQGVAFAGEDKPKVSSSLNHGLHNTTSRLLQRQRRKHWEGNKTAHLAGLLCTAGKYWQCKWWNPCTGLHADKLCSSSAKRCLQTLEIRETSRCTDRKVLASGHQGFYSTSERLMQAWLQTRNVDITDNVQAIDVCF